MMALECVATVSTQLQEQARTADDGNFGILPLVCVPPNKLWAQSAQKDTKPKYLSSMES